MSSRRKGKPQQRKKIETHHFASTTSWVRYFQELFELKQTDRDRIISECQSITLSPQTLEPEQDFITCGDCQREFVLSDIVRFIQHKVNRCNKENVQPDFPNNTDYGHCDDDDDPVSVINSRRTSVSISAPIREKMSPKPSLVPTTHEDLPPLRDKRRPEDITDDNDYGSSSSNNGELEANNEEDNDDVKPRYIDAEANTVYSEPSSFICGTCKSEYSSSWFLMQHAQTKHSLKIYIDPAANSPTSHSPDRLANAEPSLATEKDSDSLCLESQRDATPTSQSSLSMHSKTPSQQSPQRQSSPPGAPNVFNATMASPFLLGPRRPSIPPPFGHSPFNRPPSMGSEFAPGAPSFDPFPRPMFRTMCGGEPPVPSDIMRQQLGTHYEGSTFVDTFSLRLRQLAQTEPPKQPYGSESSAFTPPGGSSRSGVSQMVVDGPNKAAGSFGSSGSQKLKACEFCGKSFRFQSNLIVHRRSHTGEKPYKCPLCPHACTQASKLKRHMKTHKSALFGYHYPSNLSSNSDGSVRSSTSTPDSKMSKIDDDDETDEEELDEEAAALREAEAEEELRGLHEQVAAAAAAARDQDRPTDLSQNKPMHSMPPSPPTKTGGEERATDLSTSKLNRASLLQEMMEQTALGAIEQYKEAYNQAMAENSGGSEEDGREKDEEELDEEEEDMEEPLENGLDDSDTAEEKVNMKAADSHSDATEDDHDAKRIKVEPMDDCQVTSPVTTPSKDIRLPAYLDAAYSRERFLRDAQAYSQERATGLYPGIWFPPSASGPPPDMYPFVSGEMLRHAPGMRNGLSPQQSALKDGSSKPGSSLTPVVRRPMHSSGSSSIPGIAPARRRNDTCEFCGKIFRNCSNLTVHRRSHTGEKPYKCRMCSYACAQSSKLTRHMRTHGRFGKDVFKCKFCNMPFSVPSTLEKHMRKCVENRHGRAVLMDDSLVNLSNHSPPAMSRSMLGEGAMPALVSPLGSPLAMSSAMSSATTSPVLSISHRSSILGDATPESSPLPPSPGQPLCKQTSVGSPVASSPLPVLDGSLSNVAHTSPAVGTA